VGTIVNILFFWQHSSVHESKDSAAPYGKNRLRQFARAHLARWRFQDVEIDEAFAGRLIWQLNDESLLGFIEPLQDAAIIGALKAFGRRAPIEDPALFLALFLMCCRVEPFVALM
jgi:hypothetical protein